MSSPLANGLATTTAKIFSRQTTIALDIAAPIEQIWAVLTDAAQFPAWNSTIIELNGAIAPGGKLQLRSTLAPERTFKLKVKAFEPPTRLSWGDAMGTRTYTLTPNSEGGTRFQMTEVIGGPLFPFFARLIPPFDESFNQFAADLKRTAEERN
ncbi:MAG: SRPBCC family protein [Spirulinaceae cyanobacterium]